MRSAVRKSAAARSRRVAAKKAVTGKRKAAGKRAATPRKRKAAGRKMAATRKAAARAVVPSSRTGMLIRRPVGEVFNAFVDPDITSKFWFTKSNGPLEPGRHVQWDWEMYQHSIPVWVKAVEPNARIVIEWAGYKTPTTVEWTFKTLEDRSTFVSITESGFTGTGDELTKHVANSTEGFSLVLAGLKAFLEHNIRLNLVADRFPKGIEE
jgi:uncharacterized protein YndB with AHSA1/START domain